jgi:hypothetical protein
VHETYVYCIVYMQPFTSIDMEAEWNLYLLIDKPSRAYANATLNMDVHIN